MIGTSVDQIDSTYGHLLGDSIDGARVALEAFGRGVATGRRSGGRPALTRKPRLSGASDRSGRPDLNRGPLVPQACPAVGRRVAARGPKCLGY